MYYTISIPSINFKPALTFYFPSISNNSCYLLSSSHFFFHFICFGSFHFHSFLYFFFY